jgi:hypothetical protein
VKAGERTVSGLWDRIGQFVDMFQRGEFTNYLSSCGYDPASKHALVRSIVTIMYSLPCSVRTSAMSTSMKPIGSCGTCSARLVSFYIGQAGDAVALEPAVHR